MWTRECPGAKRKLIQNAQTIHIYKPKKGAININRKTQIIFSQKKRKFKMRAETEKSKYINEERFFFFKGKIQGKIITFLHH